MNFPKNLFFRKEEPITAEQANLLALTGKIESLDKRISNFISDINEIIINRARQGKTFCTLEIPIDLNSDINNVIENLKKRNFKIEIFNQILLIFWNNKK